MSGNALFQSGTSLAILFGMILGGAVIAASTGNLIWISLTVLSIAVIGYLSSRYILKQSIPAPEINIDWNFFGPAFRPLNMLKVYRWFLILLGNSWYWFYGATYLTQIPQLTLQNLHASENVASLLLTFFSVGIGLGSYLCRRLGGTEVNIKMVPIGAIGLVVLHYIWQQVLPLYRNVPVRYLA